jgi:protein-L-isoaspartate(D-aspartate) O-methyltransferase
MDFESARRNMVETQLRTWEVLDDRVLDAVDAMPREAFLPAEWRQLAYADAEIPIGSGRTLAAPRIQGRMLQALAPREHESALEIATGSGYLTALLARLAAQVTSVERDAALAGRARERLEALGIRNARVVEGDPFGLEFPRRFDVIALNESLPVWTGRFERLLTEGGRLFVVIGEPPLMEARLVTRVGEDEWSRQTLFETCLPALAGAPRPPAFVF